MNISPNITLKEATYSDTAIRKGINNLPSDDQLQNMVQLAENIFEPLRKGLGNHTIRISSFFRCEELNSAIGGAKNSQHVLGQAMDIDNANPSNREIFEYIKDNLLFDQLIMEFPDANMHPSWVHVSYTKINNRKNILVSRKINQKTVYENYHS